MTLIFVLLSALSGHAAFAATAGSYMGLDLKQSRYVGEVQNSSQASNYTFVSADLNLENSSPNFAYKLNPVVQDAIGLKNEFYFGVPEAFVQARKLTSTLSLTVGRQRRTWSRLDEEFNFGVWQPQLRWDYLSPKQEGLTGIFIDLVADEKFQVTFFTSPIYLPDQGPNFQLNDGKFSSSNRWFMQPTSRVAIFPEAGIGPDAPLYFQINRPAEEQVIMNSSFGLGVSYQPTKETWLNLNYAYKPQNQIHLGFECPVNVCGNIGGPTPLDITVVIHPMVVKHHVLTAETGFDTVDSKGYLSLTGDFPNSSDFPAGARYMESPLDSMMIAGAAYQHYMFDVLGVPSWMKVAYLKVFNVQSKDKQGMVDADQVHSSLDRYAYRDIAALEWKVIARQKTRDRLELRARYSYSVPERGGWLSSSADWKFGPFTWSLGLDILGSGVEPSSSSAGLYTRYRANDRVFGGVSYVF